MGSEERVLPCDRHQDFSEMLKKHDEDISTIKGDNQTILEKINVANKRILKLENTQDKRADETAQVKIDIALIKSTMETTVCTLKSLAEDVKEIKDAPRKQYNEIKIGIIIGVVLFGLQFGAKLLFGG